MKQALANVSDKIKKIEPPKIQPESEEEKKLRTFLESLKLPLLYSTDFVSVYSEEVMLLRHLSQASQGWRKHICDRYF